MIHKIFTKHYFIGSQRIASKLGSGRFNNVYGRNGCYVTAGQQDYAERLNQIQQQREEYYKELGIPPGVPTMKGAYGEPENTGVGYNTIITELGDHSVPENWEQYVVKRNPGEMPGPPIIWSDPQDPEDAQPGYGFIADDTNEEETFFYHSDHLGSTSYITDDRGNITQYTAYLPYGELLVDEHSSSEDLPYKFNGKELDEETGLYYYGARYLNPTSSVWYGVDPLFEKYPYVSPYCYTFGNPLKFIDPDGRDGIIVIQENQIIISANVYLYGAGATKDVATQMQKDIDSRWGGVFKAKSSNGKTFDVQVQIKVALYKGKERNDPLIIPESWNPFNRDNFIEIGANGKRSYVLGGDEGVWRSQGRNGKTLAQDDPAPHEIGHILGLDDRYSDKNGRSVPDKGWENNIMGNSKSGKVEQRNIDGILKDAMKAYDKWVQKNNGKTFKYEIDKDNPNN